MGLRPYGLGAPALPSRAFDHVHQPGRQAEAAVALRKVHPRETEVELRAEEVDGRGLRRVVLGEQLLAQIENPLRRQLP